MVEKTKIEEPLMIRELVDLSEESADKICPLIRWLIFRGKLSTQDETFPNEIKQSLLLPKFTCLKSLILIDFRPFFDNLIPISKLICSSKKSLDTVIIKNVEPFQSFFMGSIFPNLTVLVIQTKDSNIPFQKAFFEHIPKMFPNLCCIAYQLGFHRSFHPINLHNDNGGVVTRQDRINFVNFVQNLKFPELPKLVIPANFNEGQ
jgi:hypothetical protein